MDSIIEKDVAVAPVEYVTKYSLNRNFLRLVENDKTLCELASKSTSGSGSYVQSYLPLRKYSLGDCMLYKTAADSCTLYMLCSLTDENTYAPLTAYDSTSSVIVINDEHWAIAGLNEGISANPKDYATQYLTLSKTSFLSSHQENTDLSAHPTRELGIDKSTVAFTSFDNISNDRKTFFYPSHLETLTPDNSIIGGYMRKWDDGLLEYDVLFRVGYGGEKTDAGLDIISANNLDVYHRNYNNLYFRDDADFGMFNSGSQYFVALNGMKQVNLNAGMNAYYAEVKFPQEFKDLNYMAFTSNVKNVDVESYNLKNDVLAGKHDSRLVIDGLDIIGYDENADWSTELVIPLSVKSIDKEALSYIKETNQAELKVTLLSSCSLINIGDSAFAGSDIQEVVVPKNVKCIGSGAFASCEKLQKVTMHVSKDISKQPALDYNVFTGCTSLDTIVLQYYDEEDSLMLMAASPDELRGQMYSSEVDLYEKMCDVEIRGLYGISESVNVEAVGRPSFSSALFSAHQSAELMQSVHVIDEMQPDMQDSGKSEVTAADDQHMAMTSMLASMQDDVHIACGNLSGKTFSYGSLCSLTICGDDVVDCTVSAQSIGRLTLSGFSMLSSPSFISAGHVGSITVIPSARGLNMRNSPLDGLSVDALSIDMTNAYLDTYALNGLHVHDVTLFNFMKAHVKPFVNRAGLGMNSFAGCDVERLCVLSDQTHMHDAGQLHQMLSRNVQCIQDGCSIDGDAMRTSNGSVMMKPASRHLFIGHADDAYAYSVISCNWVSIIDDYHLTKRDFISKDARTQVHVDVPHGVESICSNAFSAGLAELFKGMSSKLHSPVTHVNVASTVKCIDAHSFDCMPSLECVDFCQE